MTALIHLTEARNALAKAKTVNEAKGIRDKAEAARVYLASIGESLEAQNECVEIKIWAEWRLAEILDELFPQGGDHKSRLQRVTLKMADVGVSRVQSHRFRTVRHTLHLHEVEKHIAATKAAKRELSSRGLFKIAKQRIAQAKADEPQIIGVDGIVQKLSDLDGKKFACVYADPPWSYGNQGTRAATDNHYSTMTVDEIAALPVADYVADDAHLHLWTTNAFLFEAKQIIEAWGFEYRSVLLWVKPQLGIGNYWRVSHEFLLLGIRGKAPFRTHDQQSWIQADRIGHSKKPQVFRQAVMKASQGPYLELFGREAVEQWTVFGDQTKQAEIRLFA